MPSEEETGRMFTCDKCQKVFNYKKNLKRHKEQVHDGLTWPCTRCDKTFSRAATLKKHMGAHEDKKLPGDHYRQQQYLLAAGKVGDLFPWSSTHNLLLVAPSTVCGLMVPVTWTRGMACSLMGVRLEELREVCKETAPTVSRLSEEMGEILKQARQPPEEVVTQLPESTGKGPAPSGKSPRPENSSAGDAIDCSTSGQEEVNIWDEPIMVDLTDGD